MSGTVPDQDTTKVAIAPTGTRAVANDVMLATMVGTGILLAFAIIAVFRAAPQAITMLGVGILLALAMDPVLRATQRRFHCGRPVGTLIVGSIFTIFMIGIVVILAPRAAEQASRFAQELPETIEDFYTWPIVGQPLEDADAVGKVEQFVDELPTRVNADSISDLAGRVVGGAETALIVVITAIAVMFDGQSLVGRARRLIAPRHRERADKMGRIVYQSLARYFAGSVAVALLNGAVILTSGLLLGIPLAPLAAVWAAVTNLIPQIGGFLGGSFFVLLALTQGSLTAVIALTIFLIYQQIENNIISPAVIGEAVGLTPITTMLAALIGGAAAGVPGALVATPLVGAVKSLYLDSQGKGIVTGDQSSDDTHPSALQRLIHRFRKH